MQNPMLPGRIFEVPSNGDEGGRPARTSFITLFGAYCGVIRDVMEVYIDDIVVKYRKADQLVSNLEAAFTHLREFRIKLNPKKCVFGVPKGKLLGFIISEWGIEANLEKITTIKNLGPIMNLKGVQKLMGCLASLSRFISWLGECGMPLYKLLKKGLSVYLDGRSIGGH